MTPVTRCHYSLGLVRIFSIRVTMCRRGQDGTAPEGERGLTPGSRARSGRASTLDGRRPMWDKHLAAGRGILWSPTIRAALIAGTQWLDVHCPGCGTSRAIDLRAVERRVHARDASS